MADKDAERLAELTVQITEAATRRSLEYPHDQQQAYVDGVSHGI